MSVSGRITVQPRTVAIQTLRGFYYTRQSHSLTLHNYHEVYGRFDVPYNTSLDPYTVGVVPDYPATLEQNAYTFGGWYESPGCFSRK